MSTRDYEAMFILNHAAATADFEETAALVDQILEKHGATIVQKEKWDERKLAYEIKGQRRGTYYLTYFQAEPSSIVGMNEDAQLNETILRHLVIALDVPIAEHIEKTATERELMAEDSRKNSLGGWGGSGGGRRERRGPPRDGDDEGGGDGAPRGVPAAKAAAPASAAAPAAAPAPAAPAPAAPAPAAPASAAPAAAPAAGDATSTDTAATE